jgi:hypothetical protein
LHRSDPINADVRRIAGLPGQRGRTALVDRVGAGRQ